MIDILVSGHRGEGVTTTILHIVNQLMRMEPHSVIILKDEYGEFASTLPSFNSVDLVVPDFFLGKVQKHLAEGQRVFRLDELGSPKMDTIKIKDIVEDNILPNSSQKVYLISKILVD